MAHEQDMAAAYALRHEVFVLGQDVPEELERDEYDAVSDHAVAVLGGTVVGTGRLLPDGTIGRMAVLSAARGGGVGAAVLAALEAQGRARGLLCVQLHAQVHAEAFYERAGYTAYGPVYVEAGIDHVSMRKSLG